MVEGRPARVRPAGQLALRGGAPVRDTPVAAWPPPLPDEALAEVARLLSNQAAPHSGPRSFSLLEKEAFEAAFARFCGTPFAVAVNSGATALDLAVQALRLAEGGVVVAADYGHPSTVYEATKRHRLLLLDIDAETLCLSAAELDWALRARPVRCVLTTHLAGQPGGIGQIAALCRNAGVPLIEDASHAHGAIVSGTRAGAFGAMGCFSLQASKNLTCGEGGVIVTSDEEMFQRVWRLHDIGRLPNSTPYDFAGLGGNHRMPELSALIARHRLVCVDAQNGLRMAAVRELRRRLPWGAPLQMHNPDPAVDMHAYHFVAMRYHPEFCGGLARQRFILALSAEGIPCSPGWPKRLSDIDALRPCVEEHATPVAAAVVGQSVWIDQRILLEPDGVAQTLEAIAKIQALTPMRRSGV